MFPELDGGGTEGREFFPSMHFENFLLNTQQLRFLDSTVIQIEVIVITGNIILGVP